MAIFLFGSVKGGTGKSTGSVNLAACLAKKGYDTALMDADPLGTSYKWASYREELANVPAVHCLQRYGNLKPILMDLKNKYDHIVVDTPGKDSKEMRTAALVADVLVVPFRPSQPDLDTLDKLNAIIETATDLNEKLKIYALLSIVPTNPSIKEYSEAVEYLSGYPLLKPLKSIISDRKIYRDCMSTGEGAIETGNKKAASEIESLAQEISGV